MKTNPTSIGSVIAAFASICCLTSAHAAITVTTERAASSLSTNGTFVFNTIPSNTSTDAANGLTFAVLAGTPHGATGPISNLTNGLAQTNADSVGQSYFSADDFNGLRIQVDLTTTIPIAEINTFSWHTNTRAPQIYNVYGALASANNTPGFGDAAFQDSTALAALGYTLIGSVNTVSLGIGGQHGVSIAGDIGNYRYVLFDIVAPPTGPGAAARATFYGEIDIVPVPEPGAALLGALGMLALLRRRRG